MNDRRVDRVPLVRDRMEEIHAQLAGKLPAMALLELDRAEAQLRTALQRIEGGEDALVALGERGIGSRRAARTTSAPRRRPLLWPTGPICGGSPNC